MKNHNAFFGALGLGAFALTMLPCPGQAGQRPNILIINTDDMGIGDLSCYNDGWVKTPNMDTFARQGLRLNHFYSAAPICSPSRAGLITGRFPAEVGLRTFLHTRKHNAGWNQSDYLDPKNPSMARAMKEAGYRTGHFGKWHVGGGRDVTNAPGLPAYGFDEYASTWESPDPDPNLTANPDWIWSPNDPVKRWDRTSYFVDKTLDFLKRNKGKPCFVNFWPDDMHTPWVHDEAAQTDNKTWQSRKNFERVLAEYDRQIGRLLDGLRELGLEENTIVILTSDNGPMPNFKQARSLGLRGFKGSLYEGGIKMPFIIRWPGKIKPGTVNDRSVVCAVDLFPSLCALAGAALPAGATFSGEDMSRALLGEEHARKGDLLWEFGQTEMRGKPPRHNKSPHLAIRRGGMKLLANDYDDKVELYDLAADPLEKNNIAGDHPALVKTLKEELLKWWTSRAGPGKTAPALETGNAPAEASAPEARSTFPLADPFILLHEDRYYAYGTHNKNGIDVYTSDNLIRWEKHDRPALHKADSYGEKDFWAPEVYYNQADKTFYMYYSAAELICVAASDSPLGPFVNKDKAPMRTEKAIDSSLFVDSDGTPYLFFVRFSGGNVIWGAELEKDLVTIKENTLVECVRVSQKWERVAGRVTEGPSVIKADGRYHMLYSANDFRSQDYGVGHADADSPLGKWVKSEKNPILQRPSDGLLGTGHGACFKTREGALKYVFHAHNNAEKVAPRHLYIADMAINNGVISIDEKSIIAPVVIKQTGQK